MKSEKISSKIYNCFIIILCCISFLASPYADIAIAVACIIGIYVIYLLEELEIHYEKMNLILYEQYNY